MCCCLVRLLLVAMLATQHTDFESFTYGTFTARSEYTNTFQCMPHTDMGMSPF